ncbi:MAG: formyltetrahydrofolate deformylase [Acidimicrobiales bacterium]
MTTTNLVLTLSCRDHIGIVARVSQLLAASGLNIIESQQFGDSATDTFFMRVQAQGSDTDLAGFRQRMSVMGSELAMSWQIYDMSQHPRVLVLVSRFGHCLNDLLYRRDSGLLHAEVVAVVSNHADFAGLSASYDTEFHHLPIDRDDPAAKARQEAALGELIDGLSVDLVVLARYMQVLSPELAGRLAGRAINIHHGLLPSFKGARPYHQAFDRGVKVIGATAHYLTSDLDEGPIISQAVAEVDHRAGPERLAAIGRDLECSALARAVEWHVDHRVLLNGPKTVVFS